MLPTQPETPTIPEEEEDDDEGTGRTVADHDESEGVEVRSGSAHGHACCKPWYAADSRHAVLHTHLADPKGHSSSRCSASHQIRKGQAPAGDGVLYRSVSPYSSNAQIQRRNSSNNSFLTVAHTTCKRCKPTLHPVQRTTAPTHACSTLNVSTPLTCPHPPQARTAYRLYLRTGIPRG